MERRPRAKRQALFLVHRNLRDALDLVFHRVFDGDDLVFVVLDFAQRGVERGGFAGAGGAGDQHHAVRLLDVAAELHQVVFGEAHHVERELGELLAHRFLVEHAQHGVFAVDGGHDGDAEIDQPALVAHAETAVLRHALFGDIQLAHHLDARNDGGLPVLGDGRHGVVQHAVDAVLDGHFLVARFDVNIAGAPLQRVEDGGVHQLDDRRDVAVGGGELVDGEGFVGVALFATTSSAKPSVTSSSTRCDCSVFLSSSAICESVATLTCSFLFSSRVSSSIRLRLRGSARAISSVPFCGLHGHEVVAEHQVHGDGAEQVVIDRRSRADPRTRSGSGAASACALARFLRAGSARVECCSIGCHWMSSNRVRQRKDRQIQRKSARRPRRCPSRS